jgi:hypothetical protein
MSAFEIQNKKNSNIIMSRSEYYEKAKKLAKKYDYGKKKEVNKLKNEWPNGSIDYWRISAEHYQTKLNERKKNFFTPTVRQNLVILRDDGEITHLRGNQKPLLLTKFTDRGVNFTKSDLNRMIRNPNLKINGLKLISGVGSNVVFNIFIKVVFEFIYSGSKIGITRKFGYALNKVKTADITDVILREITARKIYEKYEFLEGSEFEFSITTLHLFSTFNKGDEFKRNGMKLREASPLQIANVNVDEKFKDISGNCVREFLKVRFNRMNAKTIDKIGDEDGVSVIEIVNFCIKKKVKCIAYDINGKILMQNIPLTRNRNLSPVYFQAYDNHLYALTGPLKMKKTANFDKIEIVKNGMLEVKKLLDSGFLPTHLKATCDDDGKQLCIYSFINNRVKYVDNDEYETCLKYLKMFKLEDHIYDIIKIRNLGVVIERGYNFDANDDGTKTYCKSKTFWPTAGNFIKGGYTHSTYDEFDKAKDANIITKDKNKCYSYALATLGYLIHFDYRQNAIKVINKKYDGKYNIKGHYLYIIQPEQSTILLPDVNVYTGKTLIYAHKQGVKFTILEEMTTQMEDNYMTDMITDIYDKLPKAHAKEIINVFIGTMEATNAIKQHLKVDNIYNKEENENIDGYSFSINDKYSLNTTVSERFSIYNRKPINIQIKDSARINLYEAMLKLKLTNADVIQVKTDSFSYYDNGVKDTLPTGIIDGWKNEIFKPLIKTHKYCKELLSFYPHKDEMGECNKLYNCYAGTGKTYKNLNDDIPKLQANGETFKIITPSHSTLEEYRTAKLPCQVSQYYGYNTHETPEEDNIIFDEVGLLDKKGNDFMFRLFLKGKKITAYGDYKQLKPVKEDEHFNSKQYIMLLFGENIEEMNINRRNTFSMKYYDKLINNEIDIQDEVIKHNTDYNKAEKVICFRNKTVDKYNKKYLKSIGQKDMCYEGAYLRCTTNSLYKYNVYNNFYLTIKSIDKNNVVCFDNGLCITKNEVIKFFKLGHAITLYGAQGKSFKSFHYPKDDYYFLNARRGYTLISRLKF